MSFSSLLSFVLSLSGIIDIYKPIGFKEKWINWFFLKKWKLYFNVKFWVSIDVSHPCGIHSFFTIYKVVLNAATNWFRHVLKPAFIHYELFINDLHWKTLLLIVTNNFLHGQSGNQQLISRQNELRKYMFHRVILNKISKT